jgi:hypothetical protein
MDQNATHADNQCLGAHCTMQRLAVIGCAAGCVGLLLVGCKKISTGAGEYFVQKYSCPAERVKVAERPDLKPSQVFPSPFAEPPPPDEVKNDPERLALWTSKQSAVKQSWDERMDRKKLFEVSGCGHDVLLGCEYSRSTVGNKTSIYLSRVSCQEPPAAGNAGAAAAASAEIAKTLLSANAAIAQAAAIATAFSTYPAIPDTDQPAPLRIETKDAQRYRTELTRAAAQGANFAGHYTLVQSGAGSGTVLVAVVDSISGEVYFPKTPGLVSWSDWQSDPSGLVFHPDSSLLAVYGRSGSEEAPAGVSYFLWAGRDFHLLKFEPRDPGGAPR